MAAPMAFSKQATKLYYCSRENGAQGKRFHRRYMAIQFTTLIYFSYCVLCCFYVGGGGGGGDLRLALDSFLLSFFPPFLLFVAEKEIFPFASFINELLLTVLIVVVEVASSFLEGSRVVAATRFSFCSRSTKGRAELRGQPFERTHSAIMSLDSLPLLHWQTGVLSAH